MLGLRDLASLRIVYYMYVHLLLRKQMQEACAAENLSGAFPPFSFAMPAKVSFPFCLVLLAHNKTNACKTIRGALWFRSVLRRQHVSPVPFTSINFNTLGSSLYSCGCFAPVAALQIKVKFVVGRAPWPLNPSATNLSPPDLHS